MLLNRIGKLLLKCKKKTKKPNSYIVDIEIKMCKHMTIKFILCFLLKFRNNNNNKTVMKLYTYI